MLEKQKPKRNHELSKAVSKKEVVIMEKGEESNRNCPKLAGAEKPSNSLGSFRPSPYHYNAKIPAPK